MYRMIVLFCLLVLLALVGCNSPEPTPVAVATLPPTETAKPTETAVPPTETATEAPTETATLEPTHTATATATDTPEPTETPTEVPTDTPTPEPTETAVPQPTNTSAPAATNTAAPPPPSAPVSGAPPIGPNLVVNPGFENGDDGWYKSLDYQIFDIDFQTASNFPNFVHSGSFSVVKQAYQRVKNLEVGTNYRAGAWVKIWASNGEDRNVSDAPGSARASICVNIAADKNASAALRCSRVQVTDAWNFVTVDFIPANNEVFLLLYGGVLSSVENPPLHAEVYWDDVQVGLSPVAAVATPTAVPLSRPVPPAPVAFEAHAMRDNMNNTRSMLEQMGGLLDRLVRGSEESCDEYTNYYVRLVGSPRYDGVPGEWQQVYNEYIFAVEHGSEKNQPIFDLCYEHQGGGVTELNYGVARTGVNDSLNRLIPAIETANAMLGQ